MKQLILIVILTLHWLSGIVAQGRQPHIGDTIAWDIEMEIINSYLDRVSISAYRGKPLILDFGATYCIPCIQSLEKLEYLQKDFEGIVDFLFVTPEKRLRVGNFLENNEIGRKSSVPIVYADTALNQHFRHISTPHIVWISSDGEIAALTDHHFLHRDNINAFLKGETGDWPVKREFTFDYDAVLMQINDEVFQQTGKPDSHSGVLFSGKISGVQPRQGSHTVAEAKMTRYYAVNMPIIKMYASLLKIPWQVNFFPTQLLLKVGDPDKYYADGDQEFQTRWSEDNTYCYEALLPDTIDKEGQVDFVVQQLNIFFGIEVTYGQMDLECRVLKWADDGPKLVDPDDFVDPVSLDEFIYFANLALGTLPLISDLGKEAVMEVLFDKNWLQDINTLSNELSELGIVIEKEKREIETLVIEEKRRY